MLSHVISSILILQHYNYKQHIYTLEVSHHLKSFKKCDDEKPLLNNGGSETNLSKKWWPRTSRVYVHIDICKNPPFLSVAAFSNTTNSLEADAHEAFMFIMERWDSAEETSPF